jgi:hypothetical protein
VQSFAFLNYAFSKAAAATHLIIVVYHHEFSRRYHVSTYPSGSSHLVSVGSFCNLEHTSQPNQPKALCNSPKPSTHANGDPDGKYLKYHSGDLMQVFGSWRRMGLPTRGANDTPFTQSIVDRWTSFARSHNPDLDPAYLRIEGYANTILEIEESGNWEAVEAAGPSTRYSQWPSRQQPLDSNA